ncbi:MAG: plasmid stabilization protein [Verrucomicrobiota bacterium]
MPRGDKSTYTDKQKRQAAHIEEGYEKRGVSGEEAESRAWATVNKISGGGKKGAAKGRKENREPMKKGGRAGGQAASRRTAAERSASARKGAETRRRNAAK